MRTAQGPPTQFLCAALALALFFLHAGGVRAADPARPNILWILIEDWSADLSCYGTAGVETPHVDQLAAEGIRYELAFTTSPVCSTSRSAMMTGFHQNYIGANQHREHDKGPLPHGIRPIPHLMAEAGYFTALFPESCPTPTVDAWVAANQENYDFNTHGWPAWYPTRTLEDWEAARALWEPYVMRAPDETIPRPQISFSKKKRR